VDPWDAGLAGPVGVVQQHPLRRALVDVSARGPVSRPWLRVSRGAANVWSHPTPLVREGRLVALHTADLQVDDVSLDAGLPLGPFLSLGWRAAFSRLWGGGPVDQAIEDFHATGDFYNFYRQLAPAARTLLVVNSPRDPYLSWVGPRAVVESPVGTVFLRLLENRTTVMVARMDVQLPWGDVARALNLQAAETAVGMTLWQRFRRLLGVYLGGHVLWHGNDRLGGLSLNQVQLLGELALELRLHPRLSLLVEDRLQSPLFRLDRGTSLRAGANALRSTSWNAYFTPSNVVGGGARVWVDDTALTLYVGEDFMFCRACSNLRYSRETNAPDIALTLTMERRLPPVGP
jgi:hypothetical protein